MADCMGFVCLHVCICVLFILWNASTDSFSLEVFSNRKTTAPKWEMRRWFWSIFSCHDTTVRMCVYVYRFQRWCIILHLIRYTFHIILQYVWTGKFGFSVATLSLPLALHSWLFCLFPMDWGQRNKPSHHRPVLRVTISLSLPFPPSSFIRSLILLLSSIYLFFFGVFVLFFGLPSTISGIN